MQCGIHTYSFTHTLSLFLSHTHSLQLCVKQPGQVLDKYTDLDPKIKERLLVNITRKLTPQVRLCVCRHVVSG
jgi:hypothetical protein